jgi:outer membrane immunogenic protein
MVIRLVLVGLLLAASATTALAGAPYVGASGGANFVHQSDATFSTFYQFSNSGYIDQVRDVTYHTGYAVNAAVGYSFDRFRLEGEFGHKDADIDKVSGYIGSWPELPPLSNLKVDSYMINAYYDFANADIISPFIGGGIGVANVEVKGNRATPYDFDTNFSDIGFGYQIMAGLTGKVAKHINLDLYYRFMGTTFDLQHDRITISPYHSSNILAGLRYSF